MLETHLVFGMLVGWLAAAVAWGSGWSFEEALGAYGLVGLSIVALGARANARPPSDPWAQNGKSDE